MAYPHENALSVCLSIYSLFLEKLGISNQLKKFEQIKNELSDKKASIEQDLFLKDALCNLKVSVTNDGKMNHVKFIVAGTEFDSFQVSNDSEEIVPKFKEVNSPKLEPMVNHIVELLKT